MLKKIYKKHQNYPRMLQSCHKLQKIRKTFISTFPRPTNTLQTNWKKEGNYFPTAAIVICNYFWTKHFLLIETISISGVIL